jgi:hypothetical protein
MPVKEQRLASGLIELSYQWEESSSGHAGSTTEVILSGEQRTLTLTETYTIEKVFEADRKQKTCYTISVSELVDFIKEKGVKK